MFRKPQPPGAWELIVNGAVKGTIQLPTSDISISYQFTEDQDWLSGENHQNIIGIINREENIHFTFYL